MLDVAYLTAGIAALITLLTIEVWNFEYYAFPLYTHRNHNYLLPYQIPARQENFEEDLD